MSKLRKKLKKKDLTELVDDLGNKLEGDDHIDQVGSATTTSKTTDDHVHQSRQGVPMFRRYYSENKEITSVLVAPKSFSIPITITPLSVEPPPPFSSY